MDERIKISRPVDVTAARVTKPGPKGLESNKHITAVCSPTPPAMRSVPNRERDHTGKRVGQLTVVGLAVDRTGQNDNRWVCRCSCGYYVARSSRSIRKPGNQKIDRCDRCRALQVVKYGHNWTQRINEQGGEF